MTFTPTPARPGVTWTKTDGANVLFPNMSAPTLIRPWDHKHQTLFAGPTVVLGGGRRYASASPRQFCLFPYPYAANVTSAEDGNLLLWEGNFIKCVINTPGGGKAHEGNIECIEMLTDEVKPF